ncbi:amidohydrolase family protein [Sphingosinicella rhizophila]|uniref:Amidohydrolase family protein n=1 Tax=Sphingosinicella rhizophila TaxID=3050082 RepID=A0ABU3QA85_9SPHN|nr:amidohydrolase family protein [Sphingosinicella sp. GR2756]MDT9600197.1 amidohydrolase family protein [Sphingosinicella sp. GR2756]
MHKLVIGATIIDGVSDKSREGDAILIVDGRISAIGRHDQLAVPADAEIVDMSGKFVIPGLLNANVHLLVNASLETLLRFEGRYEELITEAAQVALKAGMTTVFDTWGPRKVLMTVRDRIDRGETIGSRIRCAGNIIGFDGPFSGDFFAKAAEVASSWFVDRVNATWVENSGRHLMWMTPAQVGEEVRTYIERGIDFVKYGATEHGGMAAGAFLQFSELAQRAIVDEAHRAGLTAQSHSTSVEGLRMSIEAGCDLVTHCNMTGPVAIPEETLGLFARSQCGAVIFPLTDAGLEHVKGTVSDLEWTMWGAADTNARNLVRSGAPILLANDGGVFAPEMLREPWLKGTWNGLPEAEALGRLATGHFVWLRAMEEKGMAPMDLLRAATRNIARAYKVDDDFGTLEAGKVADLLILDADPLEAARNYERIHAVMKDGALVDLAGLPEHPLLTADLPPPLDEEGNYKRFLHHGARMPGCPSCAAGQH